MALLTQPTRLRLSRDDYYKMVDAGLFEDRHVELIDGELLTMSAFKNSHVVATDKSREVLSVSFGTGYWVRAQAPLHLKDASEPEPDVAVVKGNRSEIKQHPKSAVLIVEVSDTTLLFDQIVKSSLYAREKIRDFWIVNLIDGQLEVYRNPVIDQSRKFGYRYAQVVTLTSRQSVAPLALPGTSIRVADLLP